MHYTEKTDDIQQGAAIDASSQRSDHPRAYRPDPGLVGAVNVALTLSRPLLLTGDPGTGKTQLAYSLAWQLASRRALGVTSARVEKFETKSTSVSRDLFYTFDGIGRFHAAHFNKDVDNLEYITYSALGRAILDGLPREAVKTVLPKDDPHDGPRRSVVLIDEIDKAPSDFPNDLLNEIEHMYFRVPELRNKRMPDESKPSADGRETPEPLTPIVIITSNSERTLPAPFMRRCVYYNIPLPDRDRLEDILLARLTHQGAVAGGGLLAGALAFYLHLRSNKVTQKRVSVAELLQWLTYVFSTGAVASKTLKDAEEQALAGLPALIKDRDDQTRVTEELKAFMKKPESALLSWQRP